MWTSISKLKKMVKTPKKGGASPFVDPRPREGNDENALGGGNSYSNGGGGGGAGKRPSFTDVLSDVMVDEGDHHYHPSMQQNAAGGDDESLPTVESEEEGEGFEQAGAEQWGGPHSQDPQNMQQEQEQHYQSSDGAYYSSNTEEQYYGQQQQQEQPQQEQPQQQQQQQEYYQADANGQQYYQAGANGEQYAWNEQTQSYDYYPTHDGQQTTEQYAGYEQQYNQPHEQYAQYEQHQYEQHQYEQQQYEQQREYGHEHANRQPMEYDQPPQPPQHQPSQPQQHQQYPAEGRPFSPYEEPTVSSINQLSNRVAATAAIPPVPLHEQSLRQSAGDKSQSWYGNYPESSPTKNKSKKTSPAKKATVSQPPAHARPTPTSAKPASSAAPTGTTPARTSAGTSATKRHVGLTPEEAMKRHAEVEKQIAVTRAALETAARDKNDMKKLLSILSDDPSEIKTLLKWDGSTAKLEGLMQRVQGEMGGAGDSNALPQGAAAPAGPNATGTTPRSGSRGRSPSPAAGRRGRSLTPADKATTPNAAGESPYLKPTKVSFGRSQARVIESSEKNSRSSTPRADRTFRTRTAGSVTKAPPGTGRRGRSPSPAGARLSATALSADRGSASMGRIRGRSPSPAATRTPDTRGRAGGATRMSAGAGATTPPRPSSRARGASPSPSVRSAGRSSMRGPSPAVASRQKSALDEMAAGHTTTKIDQAYSMMNNHLEKQATSARDTSMKFSARLENVMSKVEVERSYTPNGRSQEQAVAWRKRVLTPRSPKPQPTAFASASASVNGGSAKKAGSEAKPESAAEDAANTASAAAAAAAAITAEPTTDGASDWITAKDEASGHWYYHNTNTGESRWAEVS